MRVTIRYLAGILVTSLLCGCISLPALVSHNSFSGTVLDTDTGKPVSDIFIYASVHSGIESWDNSGRGSANHIVCQDYAISDTNGRFTFPSLTGLEGPDFYTFGEYRDLQKEPYFSFWGIGYKNGYYPDGKPTTLYVSEDTRPDSGTALFLYLQGEQKLNFRRADYPVLLKLLERWWSYLTLHGIPDDKEKRLYTKYKAQFSE